MRVLRHASHIPVRAVLRGRLTCRCCLKPNILLCHPLRDHPSRLRSINHRCISRQIRMVLEQKHTNMSYC